MKPTCSHCSTGSRLRSLLPVTITIITLGLLAAPVIAADTENTAPVSDRDKQDLVSPSSSNVTYFGSSRKSMMPGEKTEVGVHGLIEFQMFHDTVGLNNNRFDTVDIPVDGGPAQTKFSVNPPD